MALSEAELINLLRPILPKVSKLKEFELIDVASLTYRVATDSKEYVVRIYKHAPDHFRREWAVLKRIKKKVPTPELLYTGDTEKGDPCNYAIFNCIPGVSFEELSPQNLEIAYQKLGEALAKLHKFTLPMSGRLEEDLSVPFPLSKKYNPYCKLVSDLLSERGPVRSNLGEKFANELLVFIESHKSAFPNITSPASLLHGDLNPKNIIFNEPDQIYLLDWEFAFAGPPILDLAGAIRWHTPVGIDIAALEKGYISGGGKLPENWLTQVRLAQFINVVITLDAPNFPKNHVESTRDWAKDLMESIY